MPPSRRAVATRQANLSTAGRNEVAVAPTLGSLRIRDHRVSWLMSQGRSDEQSKRPSALYSPCPTHPRIRDINTSTSRSSARHDVKYTPGARRSKTILQIGTIQGAWCARNGCVARKVMAISEGRSSTKMTTASRWGSVNKYSLPCRAAARKCLNSAIHGKPLAYCTNQPISVQTSDLWHLEFGHVSANSSSAARDHHVGHTAQRGTHVKRQPPRLKKPISCLSQHPGGTSTLNGFAETE